MIRRIIHKLNPHKANIASAMLGQGLGMVGIAIGTRVLTEQASSATFGEAKLLIGLVAFLTGVVINPFAKFCMRQYHDAHEDGLGGSFIAFARRGQVVLAGVTGMLLTLGLVLYRSPVGWAQWTIPVAVGFILLAQSLFSIEHGMMITMNRQLATSALVVTQQWGLPFLTALAIMLTVDSPAVFITAQALVWGLLLIIATRILGPKISMESRGPFTWKDPNVSDWTVQARKFVTPMFGVGVFTWIVSVGDRYIMAGFVDMSEVGKYAAVYGLISAPFLAVGVLMMRLVQPFFFNAAAKKHDHRRRWLKRGMVLFTAGVSVVAVVAVGLLGDLGARLLLAEEYRQGAVPLMLWIATGYGFLITASSFETEAFASKKTLILTVGYGVAAAVNIIANLILIPNSGTLGAAQATCITFAVYFLILAWFDLRRSSVRDLGHGA